MHITGEKDGTPVKVGVAITDLTTGLYASHAVLAALIGRQKTGKGVHIDASLFDAQIASLANIGSNFLVAGQEAERQGTAHPSIVPYQTLPTKDGFIMIGAGNDKQWGLLSRVLEKPEWAADPKYATNSARVANRHELVELVTAIMKTRTTDEWLEALQGKGLPFAPINNIKKTFEHPQAIARKIVTEVDHPRIGKLKMVAPAINYDGEKMPVTRPPPVLGQHTLEVLREELGLDDDAIADMHAKGIV
jgi:succinate--hydroxymethylglutarate CoA-transferase